MTSCIIDGEMVAWNVKGSFIVSKGENIDVKSISSTGELIPCFVAFDILLLNGEVLSNLPYKVFFSSKNSLPEETHSMNSLRND